MHNSSADMGAIYVSSLAFQQCSISVIVEIAREHNFAVEFTSNIPYSSDLVSTYRNAAIKKMVHNYFPTPQEPFVLNLGSEDGNIRERSITHCIQGLTLCKESGAPFFAAHAGFCIDPKPDELGKKFSAPATVRRDKHMDIFLDSVKRIAKRARELDMPFLFENNVIISANLLEDGTNPLLCCESSEIQTVLKELKDEYIGFLLDTAHLKVSCKTLGLDKDHEASALNGAVVGIHHSDNNALVDNNKPITNDYWFLAHLEKYSSCTHVIEVSNLSVPQVKEHIEIFENYGNR